MRDDEFEAFRDDIKEKELLEPVYIHRGEVIDGKRRLRACEKLNLEPRYEFIPDETDPVRFVCSKNPARRDMSQSRKALLIALLAKWPNRGVPGRIREIRQICHIRSGSTGIRLHRRGGEPAPDQQRGRTGRPWQQSGPELVEAVRQRAVSVTDARRVIRECRSVQLRGLQVKAWCELSAVKEGVERVKREKETERFRRELPDGFTIIGERMTLHHRACPVSLALCIRERRRRHRRTAGRCRPQVVFRPGGPHVACPEREGILVVRAGPGLMKDAVVRLSHKDPNWVCWLPSSSPLRLPPC